MAEMTDEDMSTGPARKEVMQKIKDWNERNNPFRYIKSEDRNMVIMGRARTGKSTIIEVINNVFYKSQMLDLGSTTRDLAFRKILTETPDGLRYFFTFIDTPGFYDKALVKKATGKVELSFRLLLVC